MESTITLPGSNFAHWISNIEINRAQREAEQTPPDPILPPQPSGIYDVDESVVACEMVLEPSTGEWSLLTIASFPYTWN